MKGSGAFLVIIVGVLLLAAVLYGKTGCFGGFWNCLFGSMGNNVAALSGMPTLSGAPGTTGGGLGVAHVG